jgi:hypothetical protein
MHLIVPFAAPLAEAGRDALRSLSLPSLRAWLSRCAEPVRDGGDEFSLSPPHERAQARALGLSGGDGALPWAAWLAAGDGLEAAGQAWGLVTPAHWYLGTEQVSLLDPAALVLDDATSGALFGAVQDLFTSEGFAFHYGAPLRWYVAHPSLGALRCASLDRVIGRNVDRWLTEDPAVRLVRRLQNEVQMLLYTHPINDRRAAQGLLPVNSFWLSGCGVAQAAAGAAATIDERLRTPALAEDWAAWVKAWQTLDEGPVAALNERVANGAPVRLTLCGERSAATFEPAAAGWRRLQSRFRGGAPAALLETL